MAIATKKKVTLMPSLAIVKSLLLFRTCLEREKHSLTEREKKKLKVKTTLKKIKKICKWNYHTKTKNKSSNKNTARKKLLECLKQKNLQRCYSQLI